MEIDIEALVNKGADLALEYSPKLILAVITLFVGIKVINWIIKLSVNQLQKKTQDKTLLSFVSSLLSWTLKVMLLISVASMLGIATTSFVAVIGAAGLAIGFALQGTLANFAGGVLLLLFQPFKVGSIIESQGHLGIVREITIFTTFIESFNGKTFIMANGALMNGNITNWTKLGKLCIVHEVGVSYKSDLAKAKEVIKEVIAKDERVLKTPAIIVGVSHLAESSVVFKIRSWCEVKHFFPLRRDILEIVKTALDEAGIEIPFPQVKVHMAGRETTIETQEGTSL